MEISHSIVIHADIDTVWNIFTDLTCWKNWSGVLRESSSDEDRLSQGKRFRFCLRPFAFPVHVEPEVEEVVPGKRIVWSATRYGIHARHEFIFEGNNGAVLLTSREIFHARGIGRILARVPRRKLHRLSVTMLSELKKAAEQAVKT